MDDPSKCAVLVPVGSSIEPACERALVELEARGYPVRRVYGYAAIDQARNEIVTEALGTVPVFPRPQGKTGLSPSKPPGTVRISPSPRGNTGLSPSDNIQETLWIDSDISFDPDAVDRLRSHQLPIVCGIYARKGLRALACHVLPETKQLVFGAEGGLIELLYAGMGFMLVRREVYLTIQEHLHLPLCNQRFDIPSIPFFQPMIVPDPISRSRLPSGTSVESEYRSRPADEICHAPGHWYLPEDYAFCERARQCGYKIMADTTIRLRHHGTYGYTCEDAGKDKERYETFYFNVE